MISLSYYAIEKDGRTIKIRTMSVNRNVLMFFYSIVFHFIYSQPLAISRKQVV